MDLVNRLLVGLSAAVAASAVAAAPVSIDARGGVISDSPSADVTISTAVGAGSGISLGQEKTTVSSLTQAQSVQEAVVRIGASETLSVSHVAVAAGAKDLVLGDKAGQGFVTNSTANALSFEIADAEASLALNANLLLGSRAVALLGAGQLRASGAFCGAVSHDGSGTAYYSQGTSWFSVSGDGALYDYASGAEHVKSFRSEPDPTASLKAEETVLRSSSGLPVVGFRVDGGTVLRVVDTMIAHPDVADYSEMYTASVPACGMVGSNSIGVVRFDGGGYAGKLVVAKGGAGFAKGAVYLHGGASIRNICSTEGEEILGCNGYAYLGIDGGSYSAEGLWIGGSNGQLGISVTDGTFTHPASGVRRSGFRFGNDGGDVWLYVGRGGLFDGSGISGGIEIPRLGATPNSVQVTVTDGGVIDLGHNMIESRGGVVYNLNDGGVLRVGAIRQGAGLGDPSLVQFDGGTLAVTESAEQLFDGPVRICEKGATIDVAEGCEVRVLHTNPLEAPSTTGRGLVSVSLNDVLEGMTFIGPPALRVSGGKGGTAVCEFDESSGRVTGVRVTGRGWGYTTAQVEVYYGSTRVTALPNRTGAGVAGGGLRKTGGGTLVLESGNTYTGTTSVEGGLLRLTAEDAIRPESALAVSKGGVINLGGFDYVFGGYSNDGTGAVTNGTAMVGGMTIDLGKVLIGQYDKLIMTNVSFSASASIKLINVDESKLDRNAEYVLCEFIDGAPSRFPVTDPSSYENLSEAWSVVVKDEKAILKYLGGSIYLFY